MTRVSLKEAYDNKDVIAQIYAIRDTAESAEDASEQAVTAANTASDHVDALVPQVEGAVENANSASASAQASAQTVAGYENRLASVEDATEDLSGDLNAVTLRVTTAEGQIVTIQGRVTALETADGQNVKLTGPNAIGNYAVLLTGNQGPIAGVKEFTSRMDFRSGFNSNGSVSEGAVIQRYLDRTDNSILEGSFALSRNVASGTESSRQLMNTIYHDNDYARISLELLPNGTARIVLYKSVDGVTSAQTVVSL